MVSSRKIKPFFISIAISLGAGLLSWLFTGDSMEQYKNLPQPPLAPPGWLFPVVWTILFFLMGIAAYQIYITKRRGREGALTLYAVQLLVNMVWPVLFFGFQEYWLAFFWLLLLWVLIFFTMRGFWNIKSSAGALLLPYFLWVTFAGYLNLVIAISM